MLEGGGKTPILNLLELGDIGYKIVAYPLSLLGVSIQAMQVVYLNFSYFHRTCIWKKKEPKIEK